jgi:hypothetical protein
MLKPEGRATILILAGRLVGVGPPGFDGRKLQHYYCSITIFGVFFQSGYCAAKHCATIF